MFVCELESILGSILTFFELETPTSLEICVLCCLEVLLNDILDDLVNLQNSISWPISSLPKFASKKKKKKTLKMHQNSV